MGKKTPAADRSHGGPGSSHEDADHDQPPKGTVPRPGEPTSGDTSRVSGGGGEGDRHHRHHNLHHRPAARKEDGG